MCGILSKHLKTKPNFVKLLAQKHRICFHRFGLSAAGSLCLWVLLLSCRSPHFSSAWYFLHDRRSTNIRVSVLKYRKEVWTPYLNAKCRNFQYKAENFVSIRDVEFIVPFLQILKQLVATIGKIARYDFPRHWPTVIEEIGRKLSEENLETQSRAIRLLHECTRELATKRLPIDRKSFCEVSLLLCTRVSRVICYLVYGTGVVENVCSVIAYGK